jgi:PKD repeat protein
VATARSLVVAGFVAAAVTLGASSAARAEAPMASFVWFPSSPFIGEPVSLASTATDATSAITTWAWDMTGGGSFTPGESLATTTFSAPGSHTVRLRVTGADGLSSEASETIVVRVRPLTEMLPFPIVRVVTTQVVGGVDVRLLSVEAPPGARVTVNCRGSGCPLKSQAKTAYSTRVESVTVTFPRLDRFLRAGDIVEIRVAKAGEIGKYARLTVRRGKTPARFDACLQSTAPAPVNCAAMTAALG